MIFSMNNFRSISYYNNLLKNSFYKEKLLEDFLLFNYYACEQYVLTHMKYNCKNEIDFFIRKSFENNKKISLHKWNYVIYSMKLEEDIKKDTLLKMIEYYENYRFKEKYVFVNAFDKLLENTPLLINKEINSSMEEFF